MERRGKDQSPPGDIPAGRLGLRSERLASGRAWREMLWVGARVGDPYWASVQGSMCSDQPGLRSEPGGEHGAGRSGSFSHISPASCLSSGLELHSRVGLGDLGGEREGRHGKPKGWKEDLKDVHVALEMGKLRSGLSHLYQEGWFLGRRTICLQLHCVHDKRKRGPWVDRDFREEHQSPSPQGPGRTGAWGKGGMTPLLNISVQGRMGSL